MADRLDELKVALSGRYEIERELGHGGMATVYLARDVRHRREVAVKVLRPELAMALGPQRFLREIEIAAGLSHPHILPLHDSGDAGGFLYYVMPYVAGETLRGRIERERQLPIEDSLQIAREVADALGYAHSHGVVHRDIKPENILLGSGHALVADFGIARAITDAGGEELTATGMSIGTPTYMSPEQASGDQQVDGRSDIYSLACVLYEMFAGEPPYTGNSPQAVFAKRLSEPIPHLSTLREAAAGRIEDAVTRALATIPADRFSTAAEFIDFLSAPMMPEAASPAQPGSRVRGRRTVLAVIGVVASALLAATFLPRLMPRPVGDIRQLAVLPCANRLGDAEQDYIPAGIHDEIVTGLGRIGAVDLRGRNSVARYSEAAIPSRRIARELGVSGLVECSVYRVGDSIRVVASLLDGPQDRQVWSNTYVRPVADMFSLGGDIARGLANAVHANVTLTEHARVGVRPTVSVEALNLYHRGRFMTATWEPEALRRGIGLLEQAIELDSGFALAYVGLAEALALQGDVMGPGDIRPIDYIGRMREIVGTALSLDPDLAEAHSVLSYIMWEFDYDFAGAVAEGLRGTELEPRNANTWDYYSLALSAAGRFDEAIAASRRALELDPAAPYMLVDLSLHLLMARDYQAALDAANAAIELDPDYSAAIFNAGDAAFYLGLRDSTIVLHERVLELESDDPVFLGLVAGSFAQTGEREEALRILDELLALRQLQYVSPRAFAAAYLGLDSVDAGIDWLIRAAETRTPSLLLDVRAGNAERLRDHPRYPELMRLMGLDL